MQRDVKIETLGASITKSASLQSYYTVRFLVDRPLVSDAYQAYAYFRWVDDWLDEPSRQEPDRLAFVRRQSALINACYQHKAPKPASAEEHMVASLIQKDAEKNSGLQSYIRNMLAVMAFDAERRGRLISYEELNRYAHSLAVAVTEALHYFIGHRSASPHSASRYLAAEGAHIAHMLRDTLDDNKLGYFNIPCEYLKANGISPFDVDSDPYRSWVRSRVKLARSYFQAGRSYLAQVESMRCRLAGYAYIARFERVLDSMERDGYVLRPEYGESKSARAGAQMGWSIFWSAFNIGQTGTESGALTTR